mmetsp:Transcript_5179/g.15310  ORF Transcript_5179/g.15310 Transcript_5179/m.15310 type:complete len:246 (-) Transcript_5179:41-778(-)
MQGVVQDRSAEGIEAQRQPILGYDLVERRLAHLAVHFARGPAYVALTCHGAHGADRVLLCSGAPLDLDTDAHEVTHGIVELLEPRPKQLDLTVHSEAVSKSNIEKLRQLFLRQHGRRHELVEPLPVLLRRHVVVQHIALQVVLRPQHVRQLRAGLGNLQFGIQNHHNIAHGLQQRGLCGTLVLVGLRFGVPPRLGLKQQHALAKHRHEDPGHEELPHDGLLGSAGEVPRCVEPLRPHDVANAERQ